MQSAVKEGKIVVAASFDIVMLSWSHINEVTITKELLSYFKAATIFVINGLYIHG